MSAYNLKPTTIAGIKSLAKDLKRLDGHTHHRALELSAQRAGFANFEHALKSLEKDAPDSFRSKYGYISIYWIDDESQKTGRLTFCVPLSKLISKLVTIKGGWIVDRYLAGYNLESKDHLEHVMDAISIRHAIELGKSTAYALQLMDKTGLSSANLKYPESIEEAFRSMESGDHMSWWQLRDSPSEWLVLEEPYSQMGRLPWADRHQLAAKECFGNGLYLGGGTYTTVFAGHSELASKVSETLTAIHREKASITHERDDYNSDFVSPYRKAAQKMRNPRVMPLPEGTLQDGSIAYGSTPGEASKWRPNAHLSIEDHLKIGPVLAALLPLFGSSPEDPLHEVKNDLCNWLYMEHGPAVTDEVDGLYDGCGDKSPTIRLMEQLTTQESKAQAVGRAIEILTQGYPTCRAVEIQVEKLKKAQVAYLNKPMEI